MTYTVTILPRFLEVGQPADQRGFRGDVSRTVVDTLNEAREAVFVAVTDSTLENPYDLDSIITDEGGAIGPLPDGTLITVQPR